MGNFAFPLESFSAIIFIQKLHFKFVAGVGQNIICSGLEDKCYFMGNGQKDNGFL